MGLFIIIISVLSVTSVFSVIQERVCLYQLLNAYLR